MAHHDKSEEWINGSDSGVCCSNTQDMLSESFGSTNGSTVRNLDRSFIQLVNRLPREVRKIPWEEQNKLATLLNQKKDPIGNDWRLVASRLDFSRADIDVFEKADDPTMKFLGLCNTTTTETLFWIIQDINRSDVIEDMLTHLVSKGFNTPHGLPTQESLEDDSKLSHISQPFEESCSDISKLPKQPAEQLEDDQDEKELTRQFISSKESQEFWKRIPGPNKEKKWKDFWAASLEACEEESKHGGIDRFLCHVLKINYDERQDGVVRLDFFSRILKFFGPYVPGENGCLKKMHQLIKESVSKSMDGKKHSWFAGYMNKEETEKRLAEQTPGKFLVRFSGSRVEEGGFVLAVKTIEEVKQIEIEKDTKNNKLLLAGERFPDLVAIVGKLRRDLFVSECRQLLINPCPDLPLNDNFTGYVKATRHKAGKGRGRPR